MMKQNMIKQNTKKCKKRRICESLNRRNRESKGIVSSSPFLIFSFATILFIALIFSANSNAAEDNKKILILNSNLSVKKYFTMQNEFKAKFNRPTAEIDIGSKWKDEDWLEDAIHKEKPDLIFCIGSKAYIQAGKLSKKTQKILSLGINWQRLSLTKDTFVVASEVPATTQLMMYRYFFPEIDKIGVIYSKSNNEQWVEDAVSEANKMEIEIIGKAVKKKEEIVMELKDILTKVDALWLIPDHIVIASQEQTDQIFELANNLKKPVFTYEKIFGDLGAAFIVSADITTMARQAERIASNIFSGIDISERVQDPAGSYIAINLKKIEMYEIKLNPKALSSVNEFIELP